MYIVATFEQTIYLELAITELEQKGIERDRMMAVPLDKRTEPRALFDTIHRADGFSLFDTSAVLGTCFMLLGSIYGYILAWGPIIWGVIGVVFGLLLGFGLKMWQLKRADFGRKNIVAEVVLLIRCEEKLWRTVEPILWDNIALGVAKVSEKTISV